ncbi:MAG: TetR/AcrR family transcriptional regulator, partial [Cellulosimicrobium funkei]
MNESDPAGGGATTGTAGGPRTTTATGARGTTAAGLPDRRIVRGEQRRREILRTAVEVFGEQGFRGSSLREIAARVGISEAGLLHHFGSKAGLLTATLEERDRRDRVRRGEDEAAGADLLTTIRDQVRRNAETPGL